jgi:diguanylate cyclase (GGDEF)-like protein
MGLSGPGPDSEADELQLALTLERKRAAALIDAAGDPVVRFDRQLEVRGLNPAADLLVGGGRLQIPDEASTVLTEALESVMARGPAQVVELELRLLLDGTPRRFLLTAVSDPGTDGEVDGVTVVARDVDNEVDQDELARRALKDPLTGLATRVRLELTLTQLLQSRERRSDVVAVLVVLLDRFELLTAGAQGDHDGSVLCTIADRISRTARPNDLVARLSGSNFGLLPSALRTHGDAMLLADRLHRAVQDTRIDAGGEFIGSASIGVAFADRRRPVVAAELIARAEAAARDAKRAGRHRTEVHRD